MNRGGPISTVELHFICKLKRKSLNNENINVILYMDSFFAIIIITLYVFYLSKKTTRSKTIAILISH